MRIDILTLFPSMFVGPLSESIIQRARERGLVKISTHDLRDWTTDRHRSVDDYPYGGGAGMVLKVAPVVMAIEALLATAAPGVRLLAMSASGRRFNQTLAAELAAGPQLILLCGHYEGFDERVFTLLPALEEVSIGDVVLTGGELAAMVIIDSVVRLLPGAIDADSAADESFTTGLLEYPHYTRPPVFRDQAIPAILLSGHHANIDRWRRKAALRRTLQRRPDLLDQTALSPADQRLLAEVRAEQDHTDVEQAAAMAGSPPPTSPEAANVVRLATDRQHLTTTAYATADNLAARQAIYAFQDPPIDFPSWALAQAPEAGGVVVLDIGCGNGLYLRRLAASSAAPAHLLGLDLSHGMLVGVRDTWRPGHRPPLLAVADLQELPLADACCDLALAMHMLYHVPDLARAAAELRRVVRPGGVLLAATNAADHLHELDNLIFAAITHVTGKQVALPRASAGFSLESGSESLRTAFASVQRHDAASTLVIPEPGPIIRYAASMATVRVLLLSAAAWQAVLAEVERLAAAEIAAHGAVRITTHAGVFVCR